MLNVNVDFSQVLGLADIAKVTKAHVAEAARNLTVATHAHIVEQAQQKLHTRRQIYLDALSYYKAEDNVWFINLEADARWIEDGLPQRDMLDDLLKSPKAKTAKDGSKYIVVPFKHNGGATQITPAQNNLLDTIKTKLKERNIPYGKIEKDNQNQPLLGRLHSFDIMDQPVKTHQGVGQGHGDIGQPIQGPTGIPFLQGVNVYQRKVKNKSGEDSIRREIVTFRVASSKHRGQGRWIHPGVEGIFLLDEAVEWAGKQWVDNIGPAILDKVIAETK